MNSFSVNRNYTYNASDLAQFQASPGRIDLLRALGDSISRAFVNSPGSYTTLIPVKIYGGISHQLTPTLAAGAMTRTEIYDRHVMPTLSFMLHYTPVPAVAASLSYTIMNSKFNQVGAGLVMGNRIAQVYFITDNIILRWQKDLQSSYFWPYNARMFSLRFGINLLFGCHDKEEKKHPHANDKDDCPAYR